jgi:choline dehydrogenase
VEYSAGTDVVTAASMGELVLTAGVVGSAQLLQLSGIGPQAHLRDVGVDLVLDLPGVGANLHDHPMSSVVYSAGRSMPPGRHNHGEACGLVRSDAASDVLDLQILFVSCPYHNPTMRGLRVADASVMPSIVSATTQVTVYAIAERAAVLLAG